LVELAVPGPVFAEPGFPEPAFAAPSFAASALAEPPDTEPVFGDSGGRDVARARGRGTRRKLFTASLVPEDSGSSAGTGSMATFSLVPRTVPDTCISSEAELESFGPTEFGSADVLLAVSRAAPSPVAPSRASGLVATGACASAGMRVRMTRGLRGSAIAA